MSETPMKKQALLIGINEYQILPELKYARQDAEAVEQALKQNYCFSDDEVMLLTDAKPGLFKPSNRRIIEKHLEKLASQDLDLFIFGFWGHGLFRNGQRFFCPLDAISEDIEELGLSFDSLQRLLSNIRAKNTCMILDCCQKVHDRGEEETLTAADQAVMENAARDIVFRRKEKEPEFVSNVAILNSCKQGQAAYEWDSRKHGIFTAHLLDALNRRYDSVAQIVGYISKNVEKTAMELGKTQTPFYKLEGDISLPVDTKSSPLITGDVFISYRHCNADLVAPVEEELKKRGISYFIDRVGINYGMEYSEALTQAISDCKLLLLFWTPEVKGSDDIVKEVTLAQGLKKTVIPYKIGDFNITEHRRLCYHIAHLSRYEVPTQTQETVAELVNRIEQALTGKTSSQTIITLPPRSQDAIIEKPVIEKINVSVTPEYVEQKPIVDGPIQLPPLPDELVNIQAEIKGRDSAIAQLKNYTHDSLSQANAAVAQAQAQFDAWKERKERLWKNLSKDIQQSLEKIITDNPECTEADINIPTDNMSNQEYFDLLEGLECGKKYKQARLELERVQKQRQQKCEEVIKEFQQKNKSEKAKAEEIKIRFMDDVLMFILSIMPGYESLTSVFPADVIREPLRMLDKYELGWRAPTEMARARELWKEKRPCLIAIREAEEKKRKEEEEKKAQQLREEEQKRYEEAKKFNFPSQGIKAGERKAITISGVEIAFRWCPTGTFMMGYEDDGKQHQVMLSKGFWIMETEVTQKQWKAIMGNNPSSFIGDDLPVEQVSWNDCQDFCRKCTMFGLSVQLPTEAQWEYACRAGSTTSYFWGNALNGDKANCDGNYPFGTTNIGAYLSQTTPVGSYDPNAWGLYDMHGNVWEWCQDFYGDYPSGKVDPIGASNGFSHVIRGGSWYNSPALCRSGNRNKAISDNRSNIIGFRCVRNQ